MKRISIIIPAFNESQFIVALLEAVNGVNISILGFEKEVIVVDDGSKDSTYQLASSIPNVKVIRQPNTGKGAAVQNGISQSTGD